MMLGEVISKVVGPSLPMDDKLVLGDAVADPIEAHVDSFGSALFDGVVGYALGTFIVGDDGSGRLRVAHFN